MFTLITSSSNNKFPMKTQSVQFYESLGQIKNNPEDFISLQPWCT